MIIEFSPTKSSNCETKGNELHLIENKQHPTMPCKIPFYKIEAIDKVPKFSIEQAFNLPSDIKLNET